MYCFLLPDARSNDSFQVTRSMHCPDLIDLPPPPPGKTGWPWTEKSPQLPDTMSDGSLWPRVSIITPSYNQGQFIEETIRSVLLQGYPDLEYIIIDGGSIDESVEIIRKYEPWLAYWVSEPDAGQAHAINNGFKKATGDIFAWLNSDDYYCPAAIGPIVDCFSKTNSILVSGNCWFVNESSEIGSMYMARDFDWEYQLCYGNGFPQPATFISAELFTQTKGLNPDLKYILDYEFWIRAKLTIPSGLVTILPVILANYRLWEDSHTVARPMGFKEEMIQLYESLLNNLPSNYGLRKILRQAISFRYIEIAGAKLHSNCDPADIDEVIQLAQINSSYKTWPRSYRRMLGELQANLGFMARANKMPDEAFRRMLSAINYYPKLALNSGVLSTLLRCGWRKYLSG